MKFTIFIILMLAALTKCSLLEMSQMLWSRLLAGGLAKVGSLDPLRVPLIKVDQSEGNISYRIILRNVEIVGLNSSTLDSVHIAHGRLKSNLSEFEAGYVSYSDLRDLDFIRYRFHTLVKEPKLQNRTSNVRVGDPFKRDYEHHRPTIDSEINPSSSNDSTKSQRNHISNNPFTGAIRSKEYKKNASLSTKQFQNLQTKIRENGEIHKDEISDLKKLPTNVHVVYASPMRGVKYFENEDLTKGNFKDSREEKKQEGDIECFENCKRGHRTQKEFDEMKLVDGRHYFEKPEEDTVAFASQNIETRREFPVSEERKLESDTTNNYNNHENLDDSIFSLRGQHERQRMVARKDSLKNKEQSNGDRMLTVPLEKQSEYIDIVYANGRDKKMKHFGNYGANLNMDARVYDIEEVIKNLYESRRYFARNFTEGESLNSRYNKTMLALRSKMLKDLDRYANNFQEKQGYFEQGMQVVYHFGGMVSDEEKIETFNETKRKKREHLEEVTEDDVMHIILRIRIPRLQTKAEYVLTGKVGEEILRGNGLFIGNFTELVGDFTIELKKVKEDLMIVRAARAKLVAKDKKIELQGMDEKGPVASILIHGLMAAEAVAAMLADDLATKAVSEKSAEGTVYKMYKNLVID